MSENTTNNKSVRDDEIDLLDLFRRMGQTFNNWLKALGRAFMISFVFMFRRWLPLGLSVIAGIVISVFLKSTSESYFTSDMTLRSNAVPAAELISHLNRLGTYNREGNISVLTDALSMSQESVDNIIDIGAFWIIDKNKDEIPDHVDYKNNHNVYDTTNIRMNDRLDVRVTIKSPDALNLLRDGIIQYINSDSLFQQRNRVRLRQNQELLSRMNYDILQLDSLQKVKYFEETRNRQPQSGGQMIFLQEQKTQLVYTDIYVLYNRKQTLETESELYGGIVTLLSDFSLPAARDNNTLFYGKKYIPLFFIITLIILIVAANRKKLEETFKKY
jgi:hypothetical protein